MTPVKASRSAGCNPRRCGRGRVRVGVPGRGCGRVRGCVCIVIVIVIVVIVVVIVIVVLGCMYSLNFVYVLSQYGNCIYIHKKDIYN